MVCGHLLVISGCLLVICGHLLVVVSCRLLVVCGGFQKVRGRLLVVCGGLWSLPAIVTAGTVTTHNQKMKLVKEI